MNCPKCQGFKLELLRYHRNQRNITILCLRCRMEFQSTAAAVGREVKLMVQRYYAKRDSSVGTVRPRRRCGGCGR